MKFVSIFPVDSYVVINKSILNDSDRKILNILYQPIVGGIAINLYFSLWADLNRGEVVSSEYTHHHLMSYTKLSLDEIVNSRKKLEAIGLIKTHYKGGELNNYVYELYSPLSASEFFSNPILSFSLFSSVGKKEYDSIINYFRMSKINFEGFENISTKFSDIYRMTTKDIDDVTVKDIKKKDKLDIMVDDFVDFSFIEASLSKSLGNNFLTDKLKKLINKLAYLYNHDNMIMSNIILNSLNDKGEISESELKKNSKNYYLFENKGKTPKLIYSSKINKEENKPENTREELISCFENASPYDFLKARYKGAKPTKRDTTLLEGLLVDQELQPGVINVLIDYVLRTNDKKLNNNYVEAIASQWKMLGITSVEDAMKRAKKEFNKKKKVIEPTEGKKVNTLPNWYDKKIERNDMSIEEEKELKEMLKEFE